MVTESLFIYEEFKVSDPINLILIKSLLDPIGFTILIFKNRHDSLPTTPKINFLVQE